MSRSHRHNRLSFRRAERKRKTRSKRSLAWPNAYFSGALSPERERLLSIEPLEDRRVLSGLTITVNTANDTHAASASTSDQDASGNVSLRSAIEFLNAAALSAPTIDFDNSIGGTIDLSLGELLITEPMTISGPRSGALTVSGNNQSRIFDINDSNVATAISVAIDGLTLTGGNGAGPSANATVQGGAIYNAEGLTLGHVVVTGNTAVGSAQAPTTAYGGGIYNAAGASLAMNTVTVSDNTATGSLGDAASGGGIYNAGSLTSTGGTISGNTVQSGAGSAGRGGGIYNAGNFTSSNDSLELNTAKGHGGSLGNGYGGGIDNSGSLALTGDTLSGNLALGELNGTSDPSAGYGGGIYSTASLTSTDDKFTGNTAKGGGPNSFSGAAYGGGIYTTASLTSTNDTIAGNTAQGGDGSFGGDGDGGGIYTTVGLTLINATLNGNLAQGGGGNDGGHGGKGAGGGIYSSGTLTLMSDTLASNTAQGGSGGTDVHGGNGAGGGIYTTASLTSTDDTLAGNTARGGSAGGGGTGGSGGGGGIYSTASLTLTNNTLAGNTAQGNTGGSSNGSGVGGGIDKAGGTLNLANNLVAGNTATTGANINGAIDHDNGGNLIGTSGDLLSQVLATGGNGGPLLANNGGPTQTIALVPGSPAIGAAKTLTTITAALNATDTTVTVNDATFLAVGEVLAIDQEIVVISGISGATITVARGQDGSTAASHTSGAAVHLALDQRGFVRNTQDIGAFGWQASLLVLVNTLADAHVDGYTTLREAVDEGNAAGGAIITFAPSLWTSGPATIDLTQGRLEISASMTIDGPGAKLLTVDQTTTDSGGPVVQVDATDAHQSEVTVSLSGLTLTGVQAGFFSDGGIQNAGTLTLKAMVLSENSGGLGAGAYNTGTLTVANSTISGNTSSESGGGIYNSGTLTLTDSTIAGNSGGDGGGIYNSGTMLLADSTVSSNSVGGGSGAGIYAAGGQATLIGCTVSGNQKGTEGGGTGGGGIYHSGGTLTIIDSTISGNYAPTDNGDGGGGIQSVGGALTVANSTVSNNTVFNGKGGGILVTGGTAALANTIVAGNSFTSDGSDPDVAGSFNASQHNLIGVMGDASGFGGNGNIIAGSDDTSTLGLGPLANNGGPTQTIALLTGSPAIGAAGALATLQASLNATDASDTVAVSDATFLAVAEVLQIDQEIVVVTAVSGNTVTLTRGQDGTIEAGHASGASLYLALDQRGFVRHTQDIGAFGSQASLVVTTLADAHVDGYTTLREAVDEANANAAVAGKVIITFAPSLLTAGPATIDLIQGQLKIAASMTIDGPGANKLTIDQTTSGGARLFLVDATDSGSNPISDSLSGLTLTGGSGDNVGGAINNHGSLTLTGMVVDNNQADEGGGVFNSGSLFINDSTISRNSASHGGGIESSGTLAIEGSVISGNSGSATGGGIIAGGDTSIVDSTITGNSSANAGGIDADGTVQIANSTISSNSASPVGGGIRNSGTLTINGCTITGNAADIAGGGIDNLGTLLLTDSTLFGNTAGNVGGGIDDGGTSTIVNCTISGNSAGEFGGGIGNATSDKIVNTIIAGNGAKDGGPDVFGNFSITAHDLVGLVGNATGFTVNNTAINGNVVGITSAIDALLGPLADNGGPTQTMAPLGGSPAIGKAGPLAITEIALNGTDTSDIVPVSDTTFLAVGEALSIGQEIVVVTAVDANANTITFSRGQDGSTEATHASGDAVNLASDQRGLPRIVNGAVDIGAFQTQSTGQTSGPSLSDYKATAGGTYTIELVAGSSPPQVEIVDSGGDVLVQAALSSISSIVVTNTSGQPVQLVVDSTNGAIPVPVKFDGGAATGSSLVLQGGTATSDTYSPGPNGGQGTDTLVIGGVTETVSFLNLTPVYDSVAGNITVTATNGNDAVNYVEGNDTSAAANVAWGQVTVNNLEALNFTNKATLTINSLAGTDTVDLNNPNTPTGLTNINVNGSEPAGNVALTAHTEPGVANAMIVTPTGTGSGALANVYQPQPTVTFTDTSQLDVVARTIDSNQQLVYTGTSGNDTLELTPGATGDSGTIVGSEAGASGFAFVPLMFRGFNDTPGGAAAVDLGSAFGNGAAGGADTAIIDGTSGDDTFTIESSPDYGNSNAVIETVAGVQHVEVAVDPTRGVSHVVLRSLGGNDVVNAVMPTVQSTISYSIEGDGPSGGTTTLSYTAPIGAATTVDLAAGTITAAGANAISFTGVTSVKLDAKGGAVTVLGTSQDDAFTYTPEAADEGLIQLASSALSLDVSDLNGAALKLDPKGGANTVTVDVAGSNRTITTTFGDTTTVAVGGLLSIGLVAADIDKLFLTGNGDSNQYAFNGTGGSAHVQLESSGALDALILGGGDGGNDSYNVAYGSDDHSGLAQYRLGFRDSPLMSFSGIAFVVVPGDGGGGTDGLAVFGDGGNDTFNLTGSGPDGGTLQVNSGFSLSFALGTNSSSLLLAGGINFTGADDHYTIEQPPGWQISHVDIFNSVFAASTAATVTLNAEAFSGTDAFTYSPFSASGGTAALTSGGSQTTYFLADVSQVNVAELGTAKASLSVTNANAVITPSGTLGSGTVKATDLGNTKALMPLTYSNIATVTASGTSAVIDAPDDGDNVTVSAAGVVTITNKLGVTNTIDASGYNSLALDLIGKNDTLTIQKGNSALFAGGVTVLGDASSSVQITGDGTEAMTVIMSGGTNQTMITGGGFSSLNLDGVTNVRLDANGGALTVDGTSQNDAFTYTPEAADEGLIQLTSSALSLDVSDLKGATLALDPLNGANTVTVGVPQPNQSIAINFGNTTTVDVGGFLPIALVSADTDTLTIGGAGGGNLYTLSGTGGPQSVSLVAGAANNDIILPGAGQFDNYLFSGGADPNSGAVQYIMAGQFSPSVSFQGVTGIVIPSDGSPGNNTLEMYGDGGNDNFNLTGSFGGAGSLQMNGGFEINFDLGTADSNIDLFGSFLSAGGNDAYTINQPPNWGIAGVALNGGNAGATLSLNGEGVSGTDAFTYTSSDTNSGTVTFKSGGSQTEYVWNRLATLNIADDGFVPASLAFVNEDAVVTPGAASDSGTATVPDHFDNTLLPVRYTHISTVTGIGNSIAINVNDIGDNITVSAAGVVTITNQQGMQNTIDASGYTSLALDLIGKNDTVTFQKGNSSLFSGGVTVVGDASDSVHITGDGTAMTVSMSGGSLNQTTIAGGGFASLNIEGVTDIHLDANGGAVTASDTAQNGAFTFTPEAADQGLIQLATSSTRLDVSDLKGAMLLIDPAGGNSSVAVDDKAGSDTFTTALGDTTTVTVASLLPVSVVAANTGSLALNSVASPQYVFSGSGGPSNINITSVGSSSMVLPPHGGSYIIASGFVATAGNVFRTVNVEGVVIDGAGTATHMQVIGLGYTVNSSGTIGGEINVAGGFDVLFDDVGAGNNSLALTAPNAGESFQINQVSQWDFGTVFIKSPAGGSVLLKAGGSGGIDAFSYTPTGPQNAQVDLTTDGATNHYSLSGVGDLNFDEVGHTTASLVVNNANAVITPAVTPNSGTVTTTDVNNVTPLLPLTYTNIAAVTASGTSAVIEAPDDGDKVTVSAAGVVTITNLLGVQNTIDAGGYASLAIDLLGANDTVSFLGDNAARFTGGVTVVGGASGYTVTAAVAAAAGLDFAGDSLAGIFGGKVKLIGAANLTLTGKGATAMTLSNYGAPSTLTGVTLAADTTIAVTTSGTGNTVDYTSLSPTAATLNLAAVGPMINITGFNNAPGNLTLASSAGRNALDVLGSGGNDQFTVSMAGTATRVLQNTGGDWLPLDFTGFTALTIDGGAGNDTLALHSSAGAVTTPIVFDGGTGSNALVLSGGAATSDTYSPGPGNGQGTDTLAIGGQTESVQFNNLTPVYDSVPGPVTLTGTSGNDAISYAEGNNTSGAADTGWGQVTVNNLESLNFTNKTALTINTGLGKDTVSISNPNTPTALTGVNVTGGDANADDTLTVSGTTSNDLIDFAPTSATAATITGAGPVTISATGMGQTAINGQGGNDALTVTSPHSSDFTFTPGSSPDAGSVTMHSLPTGQLMTLVFSGLGNAGTLIFADASGKAVDGLDVYGTNSDNQFVLLPDGSLQIVKPTFFIPLTIHIDTPGVNDLRLIGQGGNDTFNIPGTYSRAVALDIQGDPAGANILNFSGDGAAPVTVDLAALSVVESGFTPVFLSNIGTLNLNAAGAAVKVADGNANANVSVAPTTATSATLQAPGQAPLVNVNNSGTFSVSLTGTGDTLIVNGTAVADTFAASAASVAITGLLKINASGEAALNLNGGAGSDTFNVTPSATVPISVDGGDPVGVKPGDTINLAVSGTTVAFNAGPTSDSGGFIVGNDQPVSFVHIETVGTITSTGPGSGPLLIQGTQGDDDIQITATGHQSFTLSVNQGLPVQYVNVPALYIDTLAGDDQVNITGPAAGSSYTWDENIFLAGASHAPGSNNIDSLSVETPTTGRLTYLPTGAETGSLIYDQGGGNLSTITVGAFNIANLPAPPTTYTSSPGGMEQLVVNGGAAGDALNVVTPGGPDTIVYTPGATTDAASVAVGGLLPLSVTNLGTTASVSLADTGGTRVDNLVVNGTAGNDAFTVDAGTGAIHLNNQLAVTAPGVTNLTLNGLAGDNTYNIKASSGNSQPYSTITIDGSGSSDPDVLNLSGDGTPVTVNLGGPSPSVTGGGLGAVNLSGLGTLNLNDGGGAITVDGTAAADSFNVTPTSATSATIQANGGVPLLNVTTTGALVVDLLGGNNTLVVNGSAGDDTITAKTNVAGNPTVTVAQGAAADLPIAFVAADLAALDINGLGGNDTLVVDSTNGPITTPLVYDGGSGNNSLTLQGGTAVSDTYAPGPAAGQGADVLNFGAAGTETIHFLDLAPVLDLIAGPLVINGTPGDDAISYTAGSVAANGKVAVGSLEPIEFSNKTSLAIDSLAGSDTINLNNPNKPTSLASISIDGGDTAGSDTLTVNGTAGAGSITYSPATADGGSITGAGPVPITLTHIGQLTLNDQSLGDRLTINGTAAGNDTLVHTPSTADDAGSIAVNNLLGLAYQNLGSSGSISLAETGAGKNNTLIVTGTNGNDMFGVAANGTVTLNSRIPISETGIQNLVLNGLGGADTFTLQAPLPYTGVAVNGGSTVNNDALVLNGTTGAEAIVVNLANTTASPPTLTTIAGFGGTVSLSNIAQVNLNGNGGADALTVNGTPNGDKIDYQPTTAGGGNFNLVGLNTAFSFNIGSAVANVFTINGGGGGDQVNVRGPNSGSTFIADEPDRTIMVSNAAGTKLMPVILGKDVQVAELDAGVGNNSFLVAPAQGVLLPGKSDVVGQPNFQTPNNLLVDVVGGGPASQNTLTVGSYNPATGKSGPLDANLLAVVDRTSNTAGSVQVFHSRGPGNSPDAYPTIGYADIGTVDGASAANLPAGNATGGWVIGMYETVLGRRPSPAELSVWEKAISSNQLTGLQAAFGFIESSERLATIIGALYQQYLGRAADAGGIDYWTGIWRTNGGEEQVQAGIIGSPEYYAFAGRQYPHLSPDAAWVTALYNNLLGRAPDQHGLDFWVKFIQTNSKQSVVLGFVTSDEFRLTLIDGWFEEYLGRALDKPGGQYWLAQMHQGLTQDGLQAGIISSVEFQNRFAGSLP